MYNSKMWKVIRPASAKPNIPKPDYNLKDLGTNLHPSNPQGTFVTQKISIRKRGHFLALFATSNATLKGWAVKQLERKWYTPKLASFINKERRINHRERVSFARQRYGLIFWSSWTAPSGRIGQALDRPWLHSTGALILQAAEHQMPPITYSNPSQT